MTNSEAASSIRDAGEAYLDLLTRRYGRLTRLYAYGEDGRGNALDVQQLAMVRNCIESTRKDLSNPPSAMRGSL